jgi:hypothetical protein
MGGFWRCPVFALAVIAVALPGGRVVRSEPVNDADTLVRQLSRLSLDLRDQPLSEAEAKDAVARLGHSTVDREYASHLDAWMSPDFYKRLIGAWIPAADGIGFMPFFMPLSRGKLADGHDVYFLPHRHPGLAQGAPPCAPEEVELVRPWWTNTPVRLCRQSYQKEVSFVGDFYCPMNPDRMFTSVSRPVECGCGPRLLHCIPSPEEVPELVGAIEDGMRDEVRESAYDLAIRRKRPLTEIFTTSRTWQNGMVRLIYARREVARLLYGKPLTAELERKIDRIVDAVPVHAPPTWVDRTGIYVGTGLFIAPASAFFLTYRDVSRSMHRVMFCTEFDSVNVDREAFLQAVGGESANLQSFSAIVESPMRKQVGCSGCHMPLDSTVAFFGDFTIGPQGAYPRRDSAPIAKLYMGTQDVRGEARGVAGLMKLVIAQPEFRRCVARKLFERMNQRPPQNGEQPFMERLEQGLVDRKFDLAWAVREVLLGDAYRGESSR